MAFFYGAAGYVGIAVLGVQINNLAKTDYWYDFYHCYYSFGEEYTEIIDGLLANPTYGKMGSSKITHGRRVPDEGKHWFFRFPNQTRTFTQRFHAVGFYKKKETRGNNVIYHYDAWIPPYERGALSLEKFERDLKTPNTNSVRVISIDMSQIEPRLMWLAKICRASRTDQTFIINRILGRWNQANDYNVKIMIYGERGTGKSYIGMLLKKAMDRVNPNAYVRLYDDFDPSSIGVNIRGLALRYASSATPIVIVINEADVVYEKVYDNAVVHDPREQHTRNKQSFNNMLDAIAATPYVVTIFTTERNPRQLYENEGYRSFMRRGRIDLFAKMAPNQAIPVVGENIPEI